MTTFPDFPDDARIRRVADFDELVSARFEGGVHAYCLPRRLTGDFAEVVAKLRPGEGITPLDESQLCALELSPAGADAVRVMVEDFRRLSDLGRLPELNCITAYPRDDRDAVVSTDVYSFHADSAPVESDTWLCTYHGAPSEGLRHGEELRKIDQPLLRAALLDEYGGPDDEGFAEYLRDCCYDLHYAALPGARPYSFGIGHLWRIAVSWPGSEVPPCVHRAPENHPGDPPRLLLIS